MSPSSDPVPTPACPTCEAAAARRAGAQGGAPACAALVVPGSMAVKREAEARGLYNIFRAAGFEWREPGCSMCVSINDDVVPAGARCIATTNRNFENRQGQGSRTHLASPAMVAAAAPRAGTSPTWRKEMRQ